MAPDSGIRLGEDRRLHPMSWLFALLTHLRSIALVVLLLLFGKGNTWELWALAGAGVAALVTLFQTLTFRYRVEQHELVVREGLLDRTERHIPFARIQNIVRKQNLLHRLFNVTELTLESAGGAEPEACMRVLRLAAANDLESLLKKQARNQPLQADAVEAIEPGPETLVQMSTLEVIKLGLISNRGMLLVGSVMAVWYQFSPGWSGTWLKDSLKWIGPWFDDAIHGRDLFWHTIVPSLLFLLALILALRVLSVALALLQFYGFNLTRQHARLSTDAGLLSRYRASARQQRIQVFRRSSTWLSRRFAREMLRVDIAGGSLMNRDEHSRLKWLAPLATPAQCDQLLSDLAPNSLNPDRPWQPLHARAWIRRCRWPTVFWSLLALLATLATPYGLVLWMLPILVVLEARGFARFSRYALDDRYFVWRSGWFQHDTVIVPLDKIQTIQILHSPFDRRSGMVSLDIDTMGADALGQSVRVPYLPEAKARALAEALKRGTVELAPASTAKLNQAAVT